MKDEIDGRNQGTEIKTSMYIDVSAQDFLSSSESRKEQKRKKKEHQSVSVKKSISQSEATQLIEG